MKAPAYKHYRPSRRKRLAAGRAIQLLLPGVWLTPIGCGCVRGAA